MSKPKSWSPLLKSYPDSEKINNISFEAETLFTRLIVKCDDNSNFFGSKKQVLGKIFARRWEKKQISLRKVGKLLDELVEQKLIIIYESDGESYLHIPNNIKCLRGDVKKITEYPLREIRNGHVADTARTRNENVTSEHIKNKNKNNKNIMSAKYADDSIEYRLSKGLFDQIQQRKADFKKPNLQVWSDYIDKMIRLDKRDPKKIWAVIKWCQQDDFWQNNILSTKTLRKQFDKLELQMIQPPKDTPQSRQKSVDDAFDQKSAESDRKMRAAKIAWEKENRERMNA